MYTCTVMYFVCWNLVRAYGDTLLTELDAMATKDCIHPKIKKRQRYSPYTRQKSAGSSSSTSAQKDDSATITSTQCKSLDDKGGDQSSESTQISKTYPCISARQPYAGFILNGLKTIETRWTPVFQELEGSTVAIHVAWRDWEGEEEWRTILGMSHKEVESERFLQDGERHGRAVVAGLVDVGETWQCPADIENVEQSLEWETCALLRPLNDKFLTRLSNPRWLRRPVRIRGQRGIWEVEIPQDCL
ncbi:uncharacterized protein CXorf40 homolog [Patiria miniata]|uniref:ASCH domain-containing protein n=1 Tax=Patiria miniata TaxID=46514 RepID=A0A914A2U6_PATMI|nr:uncharacterized protein CXorf40 homolog [Patiria miniata]